MKPSDLLAPFEVCPVKPDEIAIFGEHSGEGLAAALVPTVHQLLIEGTEEGSQGGHRRGFALGEDRLTVHSLTSALAGTNASGAAALVLCLRSTHVRMTT
jgi:hypothetical protein